ncbi:MAG TPA: hypothetical protein VGO47_01900, partial [Chlamydiales bacterium]|nr:hypothetical protein [Chlamydiales bacterium]
VACYSICNRTTSLIRMYIDTLSANIQIHILIKKRRHGNHITDTKVCNRKAKHHRRDLLKVGVSASKVLYPCQQRSNLGPRHGNLGGLKTFAPWLKVGTDM